MNKNYYINIILKKIFTSKTNRLLMLKISLILIILIGFFTLKSTMQNYIVNGIEKNISYRTFFVLRDDAQISEEDAIKDLKKVNHVLEVFSDSRHFTALNIDENNIKGDFFLYGASKNTMPEITKGRMFKDKYEIVCPSNFFPSTYIEGEENLSKDSLINMKKKIGDSLKVNYSKILSEDGEDIDLEQRYLQLKVVGIYDNNSTMIDENICYGSYDLVGMINDDTYENADLSSQINSIMVQIDNIENINNVTEDISQKNYNISQALSFNPSFYNIINIICNILLVLSIIFIFMVFVFYFKKSKDEIKYETIILKSTGYTKANIKHIFYFKNLSVIFITWLGICLLSIILGLIYHLILNVNPFWLLKVKVCFNVNILLISLIIIILCMSIALAKILKKVNNEFD